MRRIARWVAVALAAGVLASAGAATNEDTRVGQVTADLRDAEALLSGTTNASDRAVFERRVRVLRDELEAAKRIADLDRRERTLAAQRGGNVEAALREAVYAVDPNTEDVQKALDRVTTQVCALLDERARLERDRTDRPASDEEALRQAEVEQALTVLDSHARTLRHEREALELRIRLALEAKRISEVLGALEADRRPSIREILQQRSALAAAAKRAKAFEELIARLDARRDEAAASAGLVDQRHAQIDEEIRILEDRMAVERRAPRGASEDLQRATQERYARARSAYYRARSEKPALKERAGYLKERAAHLETAVVLARRGLELASRETDFLRQQFARQRATFLRLMVVPFGLVAGAVALYLLLSRFVLPRFYQRDALFVARRVGAYLTVLAVIVVIAVYFLEDLKSVAAVLGIAGAAVIIALGDLCSSFAGWFVISASRKVRVGDRVEIDGHRGDVVDIQLLRTTLLELNSWLGVDEPTGRVLVIPNSFIFKSPVLNYSTVHPFVWGKLDITVTYETPAADAEALLMRVLTEETKEEFAAAGRGKDLLEKHYGADHRQYFEPRIHSVIADSGITYSLFYMCHLRKVSATRDRLNRRIIQAFQADPRLQFAYPTLRELRSTLDPNAPTAIWEAPPPGPAPRSG